MNQDDRRIHELAAWLSATDIDGLELRGPHRSICLRRQGTQVCEVHDRPVPSPQGAPAGPCAKASSVGRFLHRHPLQASALIEAGERVRRGQMIGLLQVGALLLPVTAPADGEVVALLRPHDEVVGYGEPLIELEPIGPETRGDDDGH